MGFVSFTLRSCYWKNQFNFFKGLLSKWSNWRDGNLDDSYEGHIYAGLALVDSRYFFICFKLLRELKFTAA